MKPSTRRIYLCLLPILFGIAPAAAETQPNFQRQVLDDQIQIGYGLATGRVDDDQWVDILLADKQEIVWYENPGPGEKPWAKHVIARNLTPRDNVCLAARDVDGDGLVEIAIGANWNPGETRDKQTSGTLFSLRRPTDPRQPWPATQLTPHAPTTHRMRWLRSAAGWRLAVLPLHGVGNRAGEGDSVQVQLFEPQPDAAAPPKATGQADTHLNMTHNFAVLTDRDLGEEEFLLVAGRQGYMALLADGRNLPVVGSDQSRGAGEVRRYPISQRAFVGIEPMHGTDVVLYREQSEGQWERELLDGTLNQGHALAAGNLFGGDTPEVIAGWRRRDAEGHVGIKIYQRQDDGWSTHWLDRDGMACEDLRLVDLDKDGQLDVIAAGRDTKNLVIYWNRSR